MSILRSPFGADLRRFGHVAVMPDTYHTGAIESHGAVLSLADLRMQQVLLGPA